MAQASSWGEWKWQAWLARCELVNTAYIIRHITSKKSRLFQHFFMSVPRLLSAIYRWNKRKGISKNAKHKFFSPFSGKILCTVPFSFNDHSSSWHCLHVPYKTVETLSTLKASLVEMLSVMALLKLSCMWKVWLQCVQYRWIFP